MNESVFSEKQGFTSPNHKLDKYFKDAVEKSEGRIIFSILSLHLLTIQNIFDAMPNSILDEKPDGEILTNSY